ncbi:hypothetical protein ACWKW6_31920 [Dyadobacter jiangsuensis]
MASKTTGASQIIVNYGEERIIEKIVSIIRISYNEVWTIEDI